MIVLGVESSCDETAVALVRDGRTVLASVVASQANLHAKFGGVVPEVAAREHLHQISPLFEEALHRAGLEAALQAHPEQVSAPQSSMDSASRWSGGGGCRAGEVTWWVKRKNCHGDD